MGVDAMSTDDERLPLELCVCGEHFYCPDGWHSGDDLPCSCTPDCALDDECADCVFEGLGVYCPECHRGD
jgi:hypothetical protein